MARAQKNCELEAVSTLFHRASIAPLLTRLAVVDGGAGWGYERIMNARKDAFRV